MSHQQYKTLVVVPMKDPRESKSRLSNKLNRFQRYGLARHLFLQTLKVLDSCREKIAFDLAVVTGSDMSRDIASSIGVDVIDEVGKQGLSAAGTQAAEWACTRGYERLAIIPADLASPDPEDLVAFLGSTAAVTICPSMDNGTNALLLSPPDAIPFCYGLNSAARHADAAEDAGLEVVLMALPSLKLDIDTAADLEQAARDSLGLEKVICTA